ncbi:MAG: carbohydrate-binding protein, partial [Arthrobacter sp.]|nr:carbohydrate-binding protein [Arthrobacter sp.]
MKQLDSFNGKQLSRRQLLAGGSAVFGSALMASSLAGCGGAAQASVQDIKFWHLLSGGDGIKMQGLIDKANAVNPGFKVHPTV